MLLRQHIVRLSSASLPMNEKEDGDKGVQNVHEGCLFRKKSLPLVGTVDTSSRGDWAWSLDSENTSQI
jgi:hypothetical protein